MQFEKLCSGSDWSLWIDDIIDTVESEQLNGNFDDDELIFSLENGDLSQFVDIDIDLVNGKPEIRPTKAKLIT